MSVYRPPADNGTPNEKPYEVFYPDGERFALRGRGSVQRQFRLDEALRLANAGYEEGLVVYDPQADAVIWTGERAAR